MKTGSAVREEDPRGMPLSRDPEGNATAVPEDIREDDRPERFLKEGHRFSRAGQFLVIDLVYPSMWFLNRIDPVAMTVEACNHFETLEEAVLYAESLGMEYGVAEFGVDIFYLARTGTLRMRRGS